MKLEWSGPPLVTTQPIWRASARVCPGTDVNVLKQRDAGAVKLVALEDGVGSRLVLLHGRPSVGLRPYPFCVLSLDGSPCHA